MQFQLQRPSVGLCKQRSASVRITRIAKRLTTAEVVAEADERVILHVFIAIGIKLYRLIVTVVVIRGSHRHPRHGIPIGTYRYLHIHQSVLMAQVLVLGIIGCRIVYGCSKAEAISSPIAQLTLQMI